MSVQFGPFVVDAQTRQVLRAEGEVHLPPKAFDLLCALIDRRPDVVPKNELLRLVWPDTYVVDANLNVLVGEIRRALGDDPHHPLYIRTVHGVGYAFCGAVIAEDRRHEPPRAGARFWMLWKEHTFVLAEGDNVIGRNPDCNIWLNELGVSRRHARIRVDSAADRVVLEDLNSTNGTCIGQTPITGPHVLSDGDVLQVGSAELTFRAWAADASKETERIHRRPR